jgi:L-arabinokinase
MERGAATALTLDTFLEILRSQALVEPGARLAVARAPGRLDVMGGIADYSGSLVLQRPIAEATFAAVQRIDGDVLEIVSVGRPPYTIALDRLRGPLDAARGRPSGPTERYADARALFAPPQEHWASYIAGPLLVLMRERGLSFSGGVRIVIASDVPEGKGVSSSAAVETAVMRASCEAFELPVDPHDLALLCQRSENLISAAPCGVMDQMTCVFGREDSLLALLCQPAELQPEVPIPPELALWGLDSGERHAIGGSDYGAVRTGTFMGYRILRERADVPDDYLANVSPSQFDETLASLLPEEMSGDTFLLQYGGTTDPVTSVDPARVYRVRVPTAHPIREHERVRTFRRLLLGPGDEAQRRQLGELMYQSHASYSACGLGSAGTDRIVDLVRQEGPDNGLYGARITGGGSGGTVAVLGHHDASAAIDRVAAAYHAVAGHRPQIFSGSSPGVASFGARTIVL